MRKNQRYQLILAICACTAAALLFHFGTPKPGDSELSPPAPSLEARELNFKKSVLFTSDSWTIDDGEPDALTCPVEPRVFAYVPLDKTTVAEISCSEDYLGGVKLRFKPKGSAEFVSVDLAQRDADAGDLWDIRSLLRRSANGRMVIETIVLSSSENEQDAKQSAACSIKQDAVIWEPDSATFLPYGEPGEFFVPRFVPPVNVVNDCLDESGGWRGSVEK